MIKLKKNQEGFSVIELLIVLVVIGILAAIVVATYSGIQAKSRNTTRQKDIKALQTQLESFFSNNGYYPSLNNLNSASWRKDNLPNLNVDTMIDPSSHQNTENVQLSTSPEAKVFSYQVTDSNGNSCEKVDTNCAKYTLTATYEGSVNGAKTFALKNED